MTVYKLDKFSRDKYESTIHKKALKDNGVKVLSATEHIPDSPEGIIFESMLEGYAEYCSTELSQKVLRGMRENSYAATDCKQTMVGISGTSKTGATYYYYTCLSRSRRKRPCGLHAVYETAGPFKVLLFHQNEIRRRKSGGNLSAEQERNFFIL